MKLMGKSLLSRRHFVLELVQYTEGGKCVV